MTCLRSRQPRSTCRSCLYPRAMSSAGSSGSGAAEQVLAAAEVLLGLDGGGVDPQQPAGVTRRYRFRPGLVELALRSSARLVLVSLSLSLIISLRWASIRARTAVFRSAASGL